jgi:hypothetical protein
MIIKDDDSMQINQQQNSIYFASHSITNIIIIPQISHSSFLFGNQYAGRSQTISIKYCTIQARCVLFKSFYHVHPIKNYINTI